MNEIETRYSSLEKNVLCSVNIAGFGEKPIWETMLRSHASIFMYAKVGKEFKECPKKTHKI